MEVGSFALATSGVFVVGFIVAFIVGLNTSGVSGTLTRGLGPTRDCTEACDALVAADRQVRNLDRAVADSTAERDNRARLLREAQLVAATLLAAAWAATAVPIIGPLLAVAAWAAYGAAQTYAAFLLGQLAGAAATLGSDLAASRRARNTRQEGIDAVTQRCPAAEAEACIQRVGG